MRSEIGLIFLFSNSLTLYIKYNKNSQKITKLGNFFFKKIGFF